MLSPSEETWQVSKGNSPGSELCQDVCLLGCLTQPVSPGSQAFQPSQ